MTFEPLLWSHHPPPPWKHCIFYWSGRPKKGCVCTAEWVHRHHGNSTADVWRAEQKTSRTALRDLPRGSLQCLQRLTLHREKSSIDLVGRLIFLCQLLKCSGSGCSVVRSCVHCSTFSCHDFSHPHPSRRCHLHLDWLRPLALGSVGFSFPEIGRGRLGTRCFSVWHLLDGSSCLWAGQPRILKLWGKQEKHHTFLLRNFAFFWMNFIVWSMPSRDSQAHPQGKQGTTEPQLILWNFMDFLTIFARISIFFCNGPVVKGRVRVWHVVWHLSLQDVLRVVGVAYPWCGV